MFQTAVTRYLRGCSSYVIRVTLCGLQGEGVVVGEGMAVGVWARERAGRHIGGRPLSSEVLKQTRYYKLKRHN